VPLAFIGMIYDVCRDKWIKLARSSEIPNKLPLNEWMYFVSRHEVHSTNTHFLHNWRWRKQTKQNV